MLLSVNDDEQQMFFMGWREQKHALFLRKYHVTKTSLRNNIIIELSFFFDFEGSFL